MIFFNINIFINAFRWAYIFPDYVYKPSNGCVLAVWCSQNGYSVYNKQYIYKYKINIYIITTALIILIIKLLFD